MLPTFEIAGRTIGTYAVCAMVGLLVSAFTAAWLGKRDGIRSEDIILIVVGAAIGSLLGGHLLYGLTNIPVAVACLKAVPQAGFLKTAKALVMLFSGSVFYGGLFGSLWLARWVIRKEDSIHRDRLYDLYAVSIPLFHTFGRIGCFLGGCCYGKESSFGFTVTGNTLVPDINGVCRFPVALFEAGGNLLIFVLLLWMWQKKRLTGRLTLLYLLCYAPLRFVLEFRRGDAIRGVWFSLSTSQWISLLTAATALILWRRARRIGQTT